MTVVRHCQVMTVNKFCQTQKSKMASNRWFIGVLGYVTNDSC